jgi:3-hydroxyisobutyrate dehydrogenase/2-hydroxy-3-oxopropionate reductase
MAAVSVGIVGVGRMGAAAARRLAAQGFTVCLANRTRDAAAALADELGCSCCESFAELAEASDVVLVVTAGEDGTRSVLSGDGGVLTGVRADTPVVVMSTVTPAFVGELAGAASASGVPLVDAPISGRPVELAQGGVSVFVGGPAETVERVRPILSQLGSVVHVGPTGSAAAMKLAVNTVVFGLLGALAEGVALAASAGVDRATAYDILRGSAVASPFIDLRRAYFVDDAPPPVQFSMASAQQTLELIAAAARELGVALPQTATNLATVGQAVDAGLADRDITGLARFLAPAAGIGGMLDDQPEGSTARR